MFVASFITSFSLEDARDTANNATYLDNPDLGHALVDMAHGYVACLANNPGTALTKALDMLVNEIADGFEVEPVMLHDAVDLQTLSGFEFEGAEYAGEVVALFEFSDRDGQDCNIVAGISIVEFTPVDERV